MRILKKYEFIVEARKIYIKIKEESLDYLAYLTDVGYTVSCKDDLRWIIVYISKDRKTSAFYDGIKFSDISDDIISYIEYMSDKYYIEFSSPFWNTSFAKNYTDFLFHKNHPIKTIEGHI